MSRDSVEAVLIVRGWTKAKSPGYPSSLACYFYKRFDADNCRTNERGVQIIINEYEPLPSHSIPTSYEVEVTADSGNRWFKLMAYSIRGDEIPYCLDAACAELIAAWNAIPKKALESA